MLHTWVLCSNIIVMSHRSELSLWTGDHLKNCFTFLRHKYLYRVDVLSPVCSSASLSDRPVRYARLAVEHIGLAGLLV